MHKLEYIIDDFIMNQALNWAYKFFLFFFVIDAITNLDLSTALWQIGYEPFPSLHTIWQRWSYAELHAFHLQ